MPNEYLQAMETVRDLEGFAAIVYSSNFEFEAPSSGRGSSSAATTGDASRSNSGKVEEAPAAQALKGEAEAEVKVEAEVVDEVEEVIGGEASLVQGADNGFENVWGKVRAAGGDVDDGRGPMTG